jgi:hypothetical protein
MTMQFGTAEIMYLVPERVADSWFHHDFTALYHICGNYIQVCAAGLSTILINYVHICRLYTEPRPYTKTQTFSNTNTCGKGYFG